MKKYLPYILIGLALLVAGGAYLELHKKDSQTALPNPLTEDGKDTDVTPELKATGQAPDFSGISNWINSDPLTIEKLRGKVVLVDFWTYSCINCIRTLPYITKLYETYKDQGLVIVGVHTPEFAFEKESKNVAAAVKRYNITYPVAQDNDFKTWGAYSNKYWPAHYLINKDGEIVYTHFGEGKYTETENAVRELLGQAPKSSSDQADGADVRSPEMYFGTSRIENLSTSQKPSPTPETYVMPNRIEENTFALEGQWQYFNQSTKLIKGPGKIKLYFYASKVHMVASSSKSQSISAKADNLPIATVEISNPDLYTIFEAEKPGAHVIEITIPEAGFEAFTFTFG